MTAGLVRIRSGRAAAPEGLLSCCMILHRRGCLRMLCHVVLFRRICHSPQREAYIASGTGISRLWQGCPIPTSAVACKGSRTPQESPSSQWEAVAGVAYRPRCHRARCCRASGQRPRRSLGQPPVPKGGRSVVMAARLLSLGFSAARGLC